MTLEEANLTIDYLKEMQEQYIHKAEEDAKMAEFDTVWGVGNYFIDRTEALEYAKECRQLAEWLKELKMYREMIPSASEVFIAEIRKEKEK